MIVFYVCRCIDREIIFALLLESVGEDFLPIITVFVYRLASKLPHNSRLNLLNRKSVPGLSPLTLLQRELSTYLWPIDARVKSFNYRGSQERRDNGQ